MADVDMEMPWGMHKGKSISEINSGYLKWLIENCEDDEIVEAAEEEYNYRTTWKKHFRD